MVEKEFSSIKKYISNKKFKKAEIICNRALKRYPKYLEFHYLMGLTLHSQKRFNLSLKHIKLYLSENLNQKDALILKAYNEMALKKNQEAHETLNLLKINFNNSDVNILIAQNYLSLGDIKSSEFHYLNALKIDFSKNNLIHVCNFYMDRNFYKKAIILMQKSSLINSDSEINFKTSKAFFELRDFRNSLKFLFKAEKLNNKNSEIKKDIGFIYSVLGNEKQSIKFYELAIKLKPNYGFVHFQLSRINNSIPTKDINKLIYLQNKLDKNSKDFVFLGCAISNYLEGKKEFSKSFLYLKKSNNLIRKNFMETEKWKFTDEEIIFNNITNLYDNSIKNDDSSMKTPVFIVGLPRSGTTLIEQILSNHSSVYAGGEVPFLQNEIFKNFGHIGKINFKNINNKILKVSSLKEMQNNYLKNFITSKKVFTDKTPINFLYMGFIKLIFPKSKIILCSRSKMDNLLSMYQTVFSDKNFKFSYDFSELKKYYDLYLKLLKFWDDQKIDYLEIKYEDLVLNTHKNILNLLNYINLHEEKNCFSFYKNKRPVLTSSFNQVRKPIYKSSINKWKVYKEFL